MLKFLFIFCLSLPLTSFGLSDEELALRDKLVQEHKNTPEIEEKIKKISQDLDSSFLGGMVSNEMKSGIAKMITDNPFRYMTDLQVRELLVAKGGKTFSSNPKLLAGTSEWIRDKDALPQFMAISGEKEKLKTYGISFLVVFVLAFILGLKNSKNNILKRLFFKIFLMLGTTVINFGIFYYIFQENLAPTVRILKKFLVS